MGIATTGGHRGHWELDWRVKSALFTCASCIGGLATGAALGYLGSQLSMPVRGAIAVSLGLVLIGVGFYESLGKRSRMIQLDRETNQDWMSLGTIGWSVLNGVALGAGFVSRIGFPVWYLLPLTAFASGSPGIGMLVLGVFGLLRGGAVYVWFFTLITRNVAADDLAERLFDLKPEAHRIGGLALFGLALMTTIVAA